MPDADYFLDDLVPVTKCFLGDLGSVTDSFLDDLLGFVLSSAMVVGVPGVAAAGLVARRGVGLTLR